MLGKQHVSITLATIFPFLILALFNTNGDYLIIFGSIIAASVVGSLTPDADCSAKSKLYYDFKFVYDIMLPLQKSVVVGGNNIHLSSNDSGISKVNLGIYNDTNYTITVNDNKLFYKLSGEDTITVKNNTYDLDIEVDNIKLLGFLSPN